MNNLHEIAQRIVDIDIFEARNNDVTPEDLEEDLKDPEFCLETIVYLLDIIDELS